MSAIVAVAALTLYGTGAFFSDAETSTGNVFTAGSIDLKVDHTRQTYNGVDCKTCSVSIVSDATNEVVATVGGSDPISFPHPASPVTPTPITTTYWTATIPGATWIWATDPVLQADVDNDVTYTFEKTFNWMGPISGATIDLGVAADNSYEVFLNNTSVAADTNENNHASVDQIVNIDDNIVQGINTLRITVKNWKLPGAPLVNNPGGLLYKLTIDGNCSSDYMKMCKLWDAKNLEQGDTFYTFDDVKPGDQGTDVISLHVTSNDAHVCLLTTSASGTLDSLINAFAWEDTNGNGVYDISESALYGPNVKLSLLLAAVNVPANSGKNIGVAWCAGNQAVDGSHVITCDGSGNNNQYQSQQLHLSLTGYAEQVRNNDNFSCNSVVETLRNPQD